MIEKKKQERKDRVKKLNAKLGRMFPDAHCVLRFSSPWELMVAVQLSAQCTDKRVNEVTKTLFKKYRTLAAYAKADAKVFEKDIYPTGYYRNKTKNILGTARMVREKLNGRLPRTMKEMLLLPGVARKTANVVLGVGFGVVEGIVVDVHMVRFARRFDLSDYQDPVRIERDLMEIMPKTHWLLFSYRVVEYGRAYGNPRAKDMHDTDPLVSLYPSAKGYFPR